MKEPIYKDDLKRVLINGSIYALLIGVLSGALQFLAETYMHLSFGIFVLIIAYMVARKIKESFFTFHLSYPLFAVLFFLLGFICYNFTKILFVFRDLSLTLKFFFSLNGLNYIFPFLNIFNYQGIYILNNLIDLIIFISAIVMAWQFVFRQR